MAFLGSRTNLSAGLVGHPSPLKTRLPSLFRSIFLLYIQTCLQFPADRTFRCTIVQHLRVRPTEELIGKELDESTPTLVSMQM